ncbi:MAG: tripartite tricarboxylate transporter TctB family protein [Hyphomicrobiaceae bacterium]|nr:tripartite tricarboxylate transporter TctB family protein [Hyphomicrobiaceae bacterium]
MRLKIRQQLASSLFFTCVGALALWLGNDMAVGTAADMGVGYVPRLLALGCIGVGLVQLAGGLARSWGDAVSLELWPLAFVVGLVVAFAGILPLAGLPLTVFLLVIAATLSGEAFRWTTVLLSAVLLSVGAAVVFGVLLRLQIPLWPLGWRP